MGALGKTERQTYMQRVAAKLRKMFAPHRGITIDSGAAEHVIPNKWVNCIPVRPSPGSARGVHYVAANGARIPNLGEQKLGFWTADGIGTSWTFQVCQVNKPLASVAKLVDDGWKVVFDEDLSCLVHKRTGKVIKLRRDRGVYVVDAYLEADPATQVPAAGSISALGSTSSNNSSPVFSRPGK